MFPVQKSNLIDIIRARNDLAYIIREFFAARDILEVKTPLLTPTAATDCHLQSLSTQLSTCEQPHYLQTSPEIAMKKCLAAGSGPIFQICKAFRNGEEGKTHLPEFTMLEWYRPGLPFQGLIEETTTLLKTVLPISQVNQVSYRQFFEDFYQDNPHQICEATLLACVLEHTQVKDPHELHREDLLDLLMDHALTEYFKEQPKYSALVLTDFPACQAAMSKTETVDGDDICKRFEVYVDGLELANGYDELIDAEQQRARIEADLAEREQRQLPALPIDEDLLAAMQSGMPEMTGIALGFDRLLMLVLDAETIQDVVIS